MDVARKQWQRNESVEQPFSSLPHSQHANEVPTTTCLPFPLRPCRSYYALTTFLLRPDSATSSLRFLTCDFAHVKKRSEDVAESGCSESSTTSFTSMKTLLRSYRFPLRSYYVLQVLTASIQFFKDIVRT